MLIRCAILFPFCVSILIGAVRDQEELPLPNPPRPVRSSFVPEAQHRFLGPATCASMGCHNGPGLRGGEYAIWVAQDKHARAYQTLRGEKSRQIMKNLHGTAAGLAEREPLCLQCHVAPNSERAARRDPHILAEGVSCESCHGPAEHWLQHHHKSGWRTLSAAEKRGYGMHDTASIAGRAESCVACHVGAPGMEVNHDLIAAGHPPLQFEFSAFHALMPHHWHDRQDKNPAFGGRADFEARAWLMGQAVSTRAALELLADRAANKSAPWPEFAEYECYSCHQQLQPRLPGGSRNGLLADKQKRRPGSLAWSHWHHADADVLSRIVHPQNSEELARTLKELELELAGTNADRDRALRLAKAGAAQSVALQAGLQNRDTAGQWKVPELFSQLVHNPIADESWSAAAQRYLGLAALHNAWKDTRPDQCSPSLAPSLRGLKGTLEGQSKYSPESFRLGLDDLNKVLQK